MTTLAPLYALTLHRPWPWAICYAGKRIENRTWKPPAKIVGQWIAIHAGSTFDHAAMYELIEDRIMVPLNAAGHPTGIVALAQVTGFGENMAALLSDQRQWWIGPVGWTLGEVIVLKTPIVAKGKQGLWLVEGDAWEMCEERIALARAGLKP